MLWYKYHMIISFFRLKRDKSIKKLKKVVENKNMIIKIVVIFKKIANML